jgi:hypothetical protein
VVLCGYLILTLAFVGPAAFGHGWYGPADLGQSSLLTTLRARSAAARNPLLSDPYTTVDPVMRYVVAQVRAGHLPTWNPFDGAGVPLLADEQAAVFSPFTALHYVLPAALANALAAVADLWLMATATFFWLRHHLRGDLGPAVAGAVMAFAGYQLIWLDWGVMAASALALPLGLWAVRAGLDARTAGRPRAARLALAGLAGAVALSVSGGHAETATFADLGVGLYALGSVVGVGAPIRVRVGLAGRLAGAAILGVAISAVALVPLLRYESVSQRAVVLASDPAAVTVGYPPSTVATVAFPNLFGGPQLAAEDPGYYGPMVPNYAEGNSDTVGLAVAALAPLGLLGLRRRRDGPRTRRLVVFALGLVGAEGLALYTRVAGHVWSHVPLLGHTDLNRSQDVGLLGVAVLVAVGIDVVTRTAPTGTATLTGIAVPSDQGGLPAYVRIGVPLSSLAVVTVVSGGIALRLRHHVAARGGTVARTGPIAVDNAVFEVVAALVVVAVVLALVAAKEGRGRGLLAAALVVAVAASAAIPLRSFDPTVPSGAAYPVTPSLAAVRRVVASAPTLWLDGTLPAANTNLWFGLGDVGTYDGLDLRWHDELYDRVLHLPTGGTSPARPETLPACAEGLRVLGVHWVVGAAPGALGLRPVDSVDGSTVSPVPGGGTYQLLGASTVIDDDDRALSTVASCGFRPDRTLVLDGGSSVPLPVAPPTVRPRRSGPVPGAVQVLDERASTVRLRVSVPRSSWLLIRHSWAPGWTATIDGRAVTVRRADVAFQAVDVPAGSHRVVLTYRAPGLRTGLTITLAALLVELGLVASVLLRRGRRLRHGRSPR